MNYEAVVRFSLIFFTLLTHQPSIGYARRTRLTWINGVGYSLEHGEEEKRQISRLFGGQHVHFCYNPTSMAHDDDTMGYVFGDLAQAGTQKLGRLTTEVDGLVEHLRKSLSAVGKRGCVVHIAHSQGALITHLATQKMSAEEMQRMEIIAFGGAAALRKTHETPFRRCINYYSINDPLLFIVPSAAQALRSGFVTDDDEFCFLSPRVGDPVIDHYLLSPTYAQALQWEGNRFQRRYQNPLYRSTRILYLVTTSLFEALSERLRAVIKSLLRPLLVWCIFSYSVTRQAVVSGRQLLRSRLLQPASVLLALMIEWVGAVLRSFQGEERFVPVSEIIDSDFQRTSERKTKHGD